MTTPLLQRFFQRYFFKPTLIPLAAFLTFAYSNHNAGSSKPSGQKSFRPPGSVQLQKIKRSNVVEGELIVKFKEPVRLAKGSATTPFASLNKLSAVHGVTEINQGFSFLENSTKKKVGELLKIHFLKFNTGENPIEVAQKFADDPNVEYAEPVFLRKIDEQPNDSLFFQQNHFSSINAQEAWDIAKGEDGEVIIAVLDGGTDWDHPDLIDNIWTNPDETPDNNIDDDNNGFIDDVRGWNFVNNSNNPRGLATQPANAQHGTHVGGIMAAVTNNNTGVSSLSWNVRLIPMNVSAPTDTAISTVNAYQGLAYAVNEGAVVANGSFGGQGRSNLEQELINMALENGTLFVTSAGNAGVNMDETPFYPAAYENVLSVGSVGNTGAKSGFSNYGVSVDVFAPGENILSTFPNGQYGRLFGTSMSSPLVAALAGLVKTKFPDYTMEQVREQIRATASSIDSQNPTFRGRLGRGRIDPVAALTRSDLPSVRFVGASYEDEGGDGNISASENVTLNVNVKNFLAAASNLTFTLSTDDNRLTLTNAEAVLGAVGGGDSATVSFQFQSTLLGEGERLKFRIDMSGTDYANAELFEILVNPPQFVDHDTGTIVSSVTGQGNIGYTGFRTDTTGTGFKFNGVDFLFEGGLLVSTGPGNMSDCIRGGGDNASQELDFLATSPIVFNTPGSLADEETSVVLEDVLAESPLGVKVTQRTYAYKTEPFQDFIIYQYNIENPTETAMTGLFAGLYFDWDIRDDGADFAKYDAGRRLGWVQDGPSNPTRLAATKLLTTTAGVSYRSIDNTETYTGQGTDGYTDQEKWDALSKGVQVLEVNATDVSTMTSSGPFDIAPGESIELAFAIIGGGSLDGMLASADAAQALWNRGLNSESDNLPPSVKTSVFQNPAAAQFADIIVVADRDLRGGPEVTVSSGGSTTTVTMAPIPGTTTTYSGAYTFAANGTHTISTKATGLFNGVDSTAARDYEVIIAKTGKAARLSLNHDRAQLYASTEAVSDQTVFVGSFVENDDATVYHFGPNKNFNQPVELSFKFAAGGATQPEVYRQEDENWVKVESVIDLNEQVVRVNTDQLGAFKFVGTGAEIESENLPQTFALHQNYPNPFNPRTTIAYDIPEGADVVLQIYNAIGQLVTTLVESPHEAGRYSVQWNATDFSGRPVASGLYFYRIKAGNFARTQKMILLQ